MVWIRLASLSFYLREGAVLCRSAALPLARSLSRIRLGGKSNFFPLTQSNSAAVVVAAANSTVCCRCCWSKEGKKANIQVEISPALYDLLISPV